MTASTKVGRLRVRPQVRKGRPTGKVFVDIPAGITEDGKRRRLLFDNRKTAMAFAKQLGRERAEERVPAGPATPQGPAVTFAQAAAKWAAGEELRVQADEKRANSHRTDLDRLKALTAHFADHDIRSITKEQVTRYRAERRRGDVTKRTLNAELSLLIRVLDSAGVKRPAGIQFYRLPQVRHLVPTQEEVRRILAQLDGRWRLLVWLCAEAGLRPDEAYHAIWSWFLRTPAGDPVVRVAEHEDWRPKTAYSERQVPISEALFAAIQGLERTSRWVFPSPSNPEVPVGNLRRALKTAAAKAEIKRDGKPVHFPLKMFRKAYGTTLAERRVNRATIQDLVGHQRGSPMTEQFYVFPADASVRAAASHAHVDVSGIDVRGVDLATTGNTGAAGDDGSQA